MIVDLIPAFEDNYFFSLRHESARGVIIVDPGAAAPIDAYLQEKKFQLNQIWLTHHHHDHTGGVRELVAKHQCAVLGNKADPRLPCVTEPLEPGERMSMDGLIVEIIDLPGHTLGHIGFYLVHEKILFCGDTLFNLGCGRLFEGTFEQMVSSLEKIGCLPEETMIYSAHEYTLDNAAFTASVIDRDASLTLKEKFQSAREIHLKLRDQGTPTIPFQLKEQLCLNPFLASLSQEGRESFGCAELSCVEAFARLRKMKDNFS